MGRRKIVKTVEGPEILRMNQSIKNALLNLNMYRPIWRVYEQLARPAKRASRRANIGHYARFLKSGDLCFDIGANIGRKSTIFLELGARVVAVEPSPDTGLELEARLGGNPRLTIVHAAVADAPGSAKLHVNTAVGGLISSFRSDWSRGFDAALEVPLTTLDLLIATYGVPAYCKIDVEGFELEVLRGLTQPIPVISIEYTNDNPDRKALHVTLDCLRYLQRFGDALVNFTPYDESRFLYDDWVPLSESEPRLYQVVEHTGWGDLFVDWREAVREPASHSTN
jgi:FkbM family methyltransferase